MQRLLPRIEDVSQSFLAPSLVLRGLSYTLDRLQRGIPLFFATLVLKPKTGTDARGTGEKGELTVNRGLSGFSPRLAEMANGRCRKRECLARVQRVLLLRPCASFALASPRRRPDLPRWRPPRPGWLGFRASLRFDWRRAWWRRRVSPQGLAQRRPKLPVRCPWRAQARRRWRLSTPACQSLNLGLRNATAWRAPRRSARPPSEKRVMASVAESVQVR